MDPKAIVIYDSDCGFCRVSLALLLSWDRGGGGRRRSGSVALRPLPLGTEEANRLLGDLIAEERAASWHLVLGDAPAAAPAHAAPAHAAPAHAAPPHAAPASAAIRFSAGAALAPALRLLPGGDVPAALFARFPGATERGYRWVVDHRGLLGGFVSARARRWADRVIAKHGGPAVPQ